jgi:hypothetical protein
MSSVRTQAVQVVEQTVVSWPGVATAPHQFGAVEFRLGRRELGHIHSDGTADLPFPRRVRDELVAAQRAEQHRYVPESGWVTLSVNGPSGADGVIELFSLSYERAGQAAARHAARRVAAT